MNSEEIFMKVTKLKMVDPKWAGKPHEAFKHLPNSSKGDAGEDFVKEYAESLGFVVEKLQRLGDWDLKIGGKKFEVKLASEDVGGSFQFNHIRYDSKYDYLLCVGVTPSKVLFRVWTKADVATGKAGNLVSMGKNQNSSFKLTKKESELLEMGEFKQKITDILLVN